MINTIDKIDENEIIDCVIKSKLYEDDLEYIINLIHNVLNRNDDVTDLILVSTSSYDILMSSDRNGIYIFSLGAVPDSEPLKKYKGIWS